MDESNKIVDFSERVTYVEQDGGEEGIFWDVEDFSFPVNSTPDEIYKKIVSCLKEMGSEPGRTTIWAYIDENKNETWGTRGGEFLHKKTWDSRIYFLPGGDDKPSRCNRMLIDILLWELDHPAPASLVVVADRVRGDKEFFGRVRSLTEDIYDVDVIAPPTRPVVPESSEWPRLLLARAYALDQRDEASPGHIENKRLKGVVAEDRWGLEIRPTHLD